MFSFIIIGRNEGNKLKRCFDSCKQFASHNNIKYEIIYVDSQSTDNSITIANSFEVHKTLSLKPPCNAARARNLGAQNAKGDYFIFVDGDMVLFPKFGEKIIKNGALIYPFLNGQRIDIFYDENENYLEDNKKEVERITRDKYHLTTGGLFAISRILWTEVNGMDGKLKCFEDNDLAYRIYRKRNMKILNIGAVFAEHHTVNYTNKTRYLHLASGNYFLFKGVIFRKHLFSRILPYLLKKNLSFSSLVLSIILAVSLQNPVFLLFYLFAMLAKLAFIKKSPDSTSRFARFFIDSFIDFKTLFGFMFYYP